MKERIAKALAYAIESGGTDGAHHKDWVIDQMVRALTGCPMVKKVGIDCNRIEYTYDVQGEGAEYTKLIEEMQADDHEWNVGIAP